MPTEVLKTPVAESNEKSESQDPVYLRIRDLVYQSCGIYHSEEKLYLLIAACQRRMSNLTSVNSGREYLEILTNPQKRDVEIRDLLNQITIGETCLFRSQPQLNALHNVILPELANERSKIGLKKIKLWSSGCSTGEEPYTLAMFLLDEKDKLLNGWTFEIQATDLNDNSIEKARAGIYGDYALRNTPDLYKRKYFLPVDGTRLKVKDEVRNHITFTRLNLNDDSRMLFMKGMDLIFCCHHERGRCVYQLPAAKNRCWLRASADPHHPGRGVPNRRQPFSWLSPAEKREASVVAVESSRQSVHSPQFLAML